MQRSFGSYLNSIAPVTKHLLIINVIMWLAAMVFRQVGNLDLEWLLGLHFWKADQFKPFQFLTYMFMHDTQGFAHVFFNMFSLWMFGSLVERVMTSRRYIIYYLVCGLGAALAQELVWQYSWQDLLASVQGQIPEHQLSNMLVTVGASGAVFGILLAFAMIFPNMKMYIIPFPFPIKAKWVVLGYGLIELLFGVTGSISNVAHFAHLGGMITGLILILYWKHTGVIDRRNVIY